MIGAGLESLEPMVLMSAYPLLDLPEGDVIEPEIGSACASNESLDGRDRGDHDAASLNNTWPEGQSEAAKGPQADDLLVGHGGKKIEAVDEALMDMVDVRHDAETLHNNDVLDTANNKDDWDAACINDILDPVDPVNAESGQMNDVKSQGVTNVWLTGAAGDDLIKDDSSQDGIVGAGGGARLKGEPRNDVISGGYGNGILKGGEGKDLVAGGAGDDILEGGVGNERIQGDPGDDILHGIDDDDTLIGAAGDHIIDGGPGNDHAVFAKVDQVANAGKRRDSCGRTRRNQSGRECRNTRDRRA